MGVGGTARVNGGGGLVEILMVRTHHFFCVLKMTVLFSSETVTPSLFSPKKGTK